MATTTLAATAIRAALTIRDLTDPSQGPHAMQLLLDEIETALAKRWNLPVRRERAHPVVSVNDNYDRLLIGPDAVTRDSRYTRYLNSHAVLRTHTSAIVPAVLDDLGHDPPGDVLLSCPGICYRRDSIDRQHVGEPHQLDLWRIRSAAPHLGPADMTAMIGTLVGAVLPGREWRTGPTGHPYTQGGEQIDVLQDEWIEIGECGLAHPDVLASAGLPVPPTSGLAMGLGLDRLLMLRKGIDDIRLLRATDPRIADQMLDLAPYRPVSSMPPVRRDLSIAVGETTMPEELGDRVRSALGDEARSVESVHVMSETPYDSLPSVARERLGMHEHQKNVLVQVVLRDLERTLTDDDANHLRDRIYAAIHEGGVWTWARGSRRTSS